MKGRMRPYLPELTIRDYNTYMRYLRGVRRQMYKSYGFYACHLLRTNGVLFAILSDSLAGRMPVSYSNLTLPTSGLVEISLGAVALKKKKTEEHEERVKCRG